MQKCLLFLCCLSPVACADYSSVGGREQNPISIISKFEIIHEFTSPLGSIDAEGTNPIGELVELDGRLYGTLWQRGPNQDPVTQCNLTAVWHEDEQKKRCPGSVYSLALDGTGFQIEHAFMQLDEFGKNIDGYQPRAGLTTLDGRLYGTTWFGGPRGFGEAFSFVPGVPGAFVPERTFGAVAGVSDGTYPMAPLTVADGQLYGVASKNGAEQDGGTIFRLDAQLPLHKFIKATEGGIPRSGLAYTAGKLHGTTSVGGANNRGTYFTYEVATGIFTNIASFPEFVVHPNGRDNTPYNPLIVVSNGWVYGVRPFGGANGTGIIYRGDGLSLKIVFEFDNISAIVPPSPRFSNATGAFPMGALVEGRDGMLYGITRYGGDGGTGNIFRLARDGSLFQSLYSFPSDDTGLPRRPYGGLIVGSDGALYGTTHAGSSPGLGAGGAIYKFVPPTSAIDVCN